MQAHAVPSPTHSSPFHVSLLQWSWPFNAPVDLRQYPDYGEAIKTPMDFSTIKRRIDAVSYPHPDAFLADVRLVFDNARQYNKPGSDVHVMANTLQVGGCGCDCGCGCAAVNVSAVQLLGVEE
jgi:hypothetical protein